MSPTAPDSNLKDPLFRQLTELNNELVDTQRELARVNARYAETLRALTIKDEVLSATIDGIPDCVFACDLSARVTYANAAASALCRRERSDLVGTHLIDVVKILDSTGAEVNCSERMEAAQGERWVLGPHDGYSLMRGDADCLPIAGSLVPVFDDSRKPMGAILLIRDITHSLKDFNESLGRTQRKAAESFAAGIAHELNNLLMIVLTNAEALRSLGGISGVGSRLATNIIHAGDRASDLVRRVMAVSAYALEERSRVDLNRLVRKALEGVPEAHGEIRFVLRLSDSLPPFEGNEPALIEAMRNIIDNAVESIETAGTITLETGTSGPDSTQPGNGQIEVVVRDTGRGMAPEVAARLFEPFFTTKFLGRGLGMSVVQGIVEGHSGAIQVTTESEVGTTVVVRFPLY